MMKKMYLMLAATLIAAASFAQVRFGTQVIGNAGNIATSSDGLQNYKSKTQIGVGGGSVADIGLGEKFFDQAIIKFSSEKKEALHTKLKK